MLVLLSLASGKAETWLCCARASAMHFLFIFFVTKPFEQSVCLRQFLCLLPHKLSFLLSLSLIGWGSITLPCLSIKHMSPFTHNSFRCCVWFDSKHSKSRWKLLNVSQEIMCYEIHSSAVEWQWWQGGKGLSLY